jgi:PiT family inorganic phosphate transporter
LIGALVGAAMSWGLPVSWTTVALVLAIGLAAPFASLVIGLVAVRAITRSLFGTLIQTRIPRLRRSGLAAYLLQSLAYAMNDGQKMLAVATLLAAGSGPALGGRVFTQVVLGTSFAVGTVVGVSRVASRVNQSVVPVRAVHAIASESAAGMAVLMSSAMGTPVSMTQASTAALIGTGISQPGWQVRWMHAARIAGAWFVTLPAAAVAGALIAMLGR